jgi:hypothetical protein
MSLVPKLAIPRAKYCLLKRDELRLDRSHRTVIARRSAPKQSSPFSATLDCFAAIAMTENPAAAPIQPELIPLSYAV